MKAFIINDKIHINGLGERDIVIPSQLYPLTGSMTIFTANNTTPCDDEQLRQIFDSIPSRIGRCYENIRLLEDKLKATEQFKNRFTTYVGWMFIGENMPVHHAYMVVDNKYMLDFSPLSDLESLEAPVVMSKDGIRELVADQVIKSLDKPNSEKAVFGQVQFDSLYVGSVCSPEKGIRVYKKLMRAFPKHPCFRTTSTGMTEVQNRILRRIQDGTREQ